MNCIQKTNKEIKDALLKPKMWLNIAFVIAGVSYLIVGVLGIVELLNWVQLPVAPSFVIITFSCLLLVVPLFYGIMLMENCNTKEKQND